MKAESSGIVSQTTTTLLFVWRVIRLGEFALWTSVSEMTSRVWQTKSSSAALLRPCLADIQYSKILDKRRNTHYFHTLDFFMLMHKLPPYDFNRVTMIQQSSNILNCDECFGERLLLTAVYQRGRIKIYQWDTRIKMPPPSTPICKCAERKTTTLRWKWKTPSYTPHVAWPHVSRCKPDSRIAPHREAEGTSHKKTSTSH